MNNDHTTPPAVDVLVEAMLMSHGHLALVVDHMVRNYSPDGDPIPDVLRMLLSDILEQLVERFGEEDVATAAQMLAAATELFGEELYLLPAPNRTERRSRRRRRGH